MPAIVTLTTDFGARDPYAAAVKGVLLSRCAGLRVVDLTHEIAPQDVTEGAFFIAQAAPWFPAGTVHLAVVDPGVGTSRRPLAVRAGGHFFVLPDNGLIELVLRALPLDQARVIDMDRDRGTSATFHGRDVFAPAAAALACGAPLSDIGPAAGRLARLAFPRPALRADRVEGEIVHVDRFGNLVSNIDRAALGGAPCSGVQIGGRALGAPLHTYGDAAAGELLALWNSAGLLEVAAREASAAATLGLGRGAGITARRS
jgi:S-adenosylmethionine hydrolase